MNYLFNVAGFNIQIESLHEIRLINFLEPFVLKNADSSIDIVFELFSVEQLNVEFPKEQSTGMDIHGEDLRQYVRWENEERVYFFLTLKARPYACVQWKLNDPNKYRCQYIEKKRMWVEDSKQIFDLLGIESIFVKRNVLILHSSLIRYKNQAVLFSAPSGTGKSTQADLWEKYAGADILNGDRAGLRRVNENGAADANAPWRAYGLPYAGSSGIYRNESAPIRAIIMLEQGTENELTRLTPMQAIRRMYPEITMHRWDREFVKKAMDLTENLVCSVPVYLFRCRPDEDAVRVVKQELF